MRLHDMAYSKKDVTASSGPLWCFVFHAGQQDRNQQQQVWISSKFFCNQRLPWTVKLIGIIAVASGDLVWGDDSPMTPECPRLVGEDHLLVCCCGNNLIRSWYLVFFKIFLVVMSPAAISLALPKCLHTLMDKALAEMFTTQRFI